MKKILALLMVLLIAMGYYSMPGMVESAIPSAYYITPDKKTYENVVNCAGTIQSANVREIYLQSAIVPAEVCVEVGDIVSEGDMLVRVDMSMTESINTQAHSLLSDISGDIPKAGASAVDWIAMASSYGLSAVLNGGGIDYVELNNLLQSGNSPLEHPTATAGAIVGGDTPERIISPMTGTVVDVNILPQAPASPGKAIFTIADTSNFKVLAAVGESDIVKIDVGDMAKVRGVGFGGSVYHGMVTKIYPTARKSLTGSETVVDVEITLENPDKRLKPGFSAKVEIAGGNNYDLVTVPYEAIRQDENNDEYVYVYEDGKLRKQTIVTGQELTSEVEILGGLDYGSIVVYNPNGLIKEGSMVNIKGRANTYEDG